MHSYIREPQKACDWIRHRQQFFFLFNMEDEKKISLNENLKPKIYVNKFKIELKLLRENNFHGILRKNVCSVYGFRIE